MKDIFIRFLLLLALLVPVGNGWAALVSDPIDLDFTCITNNQATDCQRGEDFMSLRVGTASDGRGGTDFRFTNGLDPGLDGAKIEEVYIDSIALDDYDLVNDVFFVPSGLAAYQQATVKPGNLPGGNEVSFFADFGAEPLKLPECTISNGRCAIEPGEFYTINFGALPFSTFALALSTNDFIIGIHVTKYNSGGSESFVTSLPTVVPVPAAFWLFGTALIGFVGFSRRRSVGA